jgi:multidrug efflux pump subunit AcrA (membrane-fusion protein)
MGNRFRRLAVAGITVVVVAVGAGTAYAAMSAPGPSYRLATAVPAEVTATLQEVGTLTPVHQADVGFAVSGTVQAVKVQPGQHVTAGQTLGTLDTAPLQAALTAAQSTLANANLQVHNDLASQDAAASGSGSSPGASGASPGTSGASPGTSPAARLASSLRPLQQAVLNAQRKADSLLAQARTALAQARLACAPPSPPGPTPTPTPATPARTSTAPAPTPTPTAPVLTPTSTAPTPAPTPTLTPTPTPTPSPSPTGQGPSPGPGTAACLRATQRVLAAEAAVLQAQQALSGRLTALTDALAKAITAVGQSSSGGGTGGGGTGGGGTASDGGTTGAGSDGGAASAAQLAADQASADAAAAQVTVAQQNLAAATLVSPISGTVVTVSATPGAAVTAGSVAFEIAGLDSYQVVAQVPVSDMPQLKAGEPASALPDGASAPLSGSVVSIGLIPDSTGPTTYPVTIGLAGQPTGLHPGGYASVTITTARSSGVSVPTSAVHRSGHKATVTVYVGGKTRVTKVTVGTMGPVMTRITAGLRAGQQVVLADLSQPLPNTNPNNQGPGPGFARTIQIGASINIGGGSVNFVGPG